MTSPEITVELINQQLGEVLKEESKIYPLQFSDESGKQGLIILNHHQNKDSIDSIRVLASMNRALDVSTIGRSIFDSVLNMGLLLYLPVNEGVSKYKLYASIEELRIYRNMSKVGQDIADKIYKNEDIKKWEADSGKYEMDYGVPKSSWSGKTTLEACRMLDSEYPSVVKSEHFFEFLYCQIYRYGSSATHRSQLGISRNVRIVSAPATGGRMLHTADSREEGLVFNYFHGLLAFLASMRVVGRAFKIPSLEEYFQKKVGYLIAGYPES